MGKRVTFVCALFIVSYTVGAESNRTPVAQNAPIRIGKLGTTQVQYKGNGSEPTRVVFQDTDAYYETLPNGQARRVASNTYYQLSIKEDPVTGEISGELTHELKNGQWQPYKPSDRGHYTTRAGYQDRNGNYRPLDISLAPSSGKTVFPRGVITPDNKWLGGNRGIPKNTTGSLDELKAGKQFLSDYARALRSDLNSTTEETKSVNVRTTPRTPSFNFYKSVADQVLGDISPERLKREALARHPTYLGPEKDSGMGFKVRDVGQSGELGNKPHYAILASDPAQKKEIQETLTGVETARAFKSAGNKVFNFFAGMVGGKNPDAEKETADPIKVKTYLGGATGIDKAAKNEVSAQLATVAERAAAYTMALFKEHGEPQDGSVINNLQEFKDRVGQARRDAVSLLGTKVAEEAIKAAIDARKSPQVDRVAMVTDANALKAANNLFGSDGLMRVYPDASGNHNYVQMSSSMPYSLVANYFNKLDAEYKKNDGKLTKARVAELEREAIKEYFKTDDKTAAAIQKAFADQKVKVQNGGKKLTQEDTAKLADDTIKNEIEKRYGVETATAELIKKAWGEEGKLTDEKAETIALSVIEQAKKEDPNANPQAGERHEIQDPVLIENPTHR